MMLRTRDLNVQKNVEQQQQQQKGGGGAQANGGGGGKAKPTGGVAHPQQKRQAAHLVKGGGGGAGSSGSGSDKEANEPRPKRACSQNDKENNNNSSNNMPVSAFSRSLLIDSAKKENTNTHHQPALGHINNNKRISAAGAGGAPMAGRKRTSALLAVRDTNAAHHPVEAPAAHPKPASQEKRAEHALKKEAEEPQEPVVVYDFDKENERDMAAVSQYAQDIFLYYKYRERFFRVTDYISTRKHPEVTNEVRAKLVDWMVELQETFELNHETLYLAVKLVDMFMQRTQHTIEKSKMQLIGSAAIFIASKFDERAPPLIDDFIYLAEDSFNRDQLLEMERVLLKVVDFDLGAPLSYRFLRRFARVCKLDMGTLTLARYVLETSLMFLNFCLQSESLIAAACLLLAIRMKGVGDWGPILDKYTGYSRKHVESLMWRLNRMITDRKQNYPLLDTVFRKYSHEIFFEVAKIKQLNES